MSSTALEKSLNTLRHRLVALGLAGGLGWGLLGAMGLLVLAMWLDLVLELPGAAPGQRGPSRRVCAGAGGWRDGAGLASLLARRDGPASRRGRRHRR